MIWFQRVQICASIIDSDRRAETGYQSLHCLLLFFFFFFFLLLLIFVWHRYSSKIVGYVRSPAMIIESSAARRMRLELTAFLALSHLERSGDSDRPRSNVGRVIPLCAETHGDSVSSCHTYPRSMDRTSIDPDMPIWCMAAESDSAPLARVIANRCSAFEHENNPPKQVSANYE